VCIDESKLYFRVVLMLRITEAPKREALSFLTLDKKPNVAFPSGRA